LLRLKLLHDRDMRDEPSLLHDTQGVDLSPRNPILPDITSVPVRGAGMRRELFSLPFETIDERLAQLNR
jgi:hypothetical protein